MQLQFQNLAQIQLKLSCTKYFEREMNPKSTQMELSQNKIS